MRRRRPRAPIRACCPMCGGCDGVFVRRFGMLVCRTCLDGDASLPTSGPMSGRIRHLLRRIHLRPLAFA